MAGNFIDNVTTEGQKEWLRKFRAIIRFSLTCIRAYPPPLYIQLEPTTRCDFDCITCTRRTLSRGRLDRNLSLEEFKSILCQIPSLKVIKLQGMGEPLLCPDLKKILEYGVSRGIDFRAISNGMMISDDNAGLILNIFSRFTVSFDAGTKATFERTRGGACYEKVVENIKRLVRLKREIKSNTLISMNFVATHLNYNEIPLFLELGISLGVDEMGVIEAENWLFRKQEKYSKENLFISRAREVKKKIREFAEGYRGAPELFFLSSDRRKGRCRWGFDRVFITVDGFVTPCCIRMDPDIVNFGNIFEVPFKDIWNSKKMNAFRRNQIFNLPDPVCDSCPD